MIYVTGDIHGGFDIHKLSSKELRSAGLRIKKDDYVIVCGDFNVAHKEIDLKNPQANRKNAGFSDEEREKFSALLDAGFVDTFRLLYPDRTEAYSWWSYRFGARKRNF